MADAYRHELKYYIKQTDYVLLSQKLRRALQRDENAEEGSGEYFIRSLYFDDANNSAFCEKIDGVDDRYKIRIRIYNMSDSQIKLECKHKKDSFIQKQSIELSREECDALIGGAYAFLLRREEPLAKRMFAEFATRRLKPRVIVDYRRETFVFPVEDVRITFDKDIRTSLLNVDLFNADIPTYPVLSDYGMVLEVKFNNGLPPYIRSLLQIDSPARSSISKYCLCRKFEL